MTCQRSPADKSFLNEGMGLLPTVIFQNNAPSFCAATSGPERSAGDGSRSRPSLPSPLPPLPWHDAHARL